MGGFLGGVGKVVGGLTGGLLGGDVSGEAESSAQTTNNGLQAGDTVALLPINGGRTFIVLGKLVYAPESTGETFVSPGTSTKNTTTSKGET